MFVLIREGCLKLPRFLFTLQQFKKFIENQAAILNCYCGNTIFTIRFKCL